MVALQQVIYLIVHIETHEIHVHLPRRRGGVGGGVN